MQTIFVAYFCIFVYNKRKLDKNDKESEMEVENDWKEFFKSERQKDYFVALSKELDFEYKNFAVYPKKEHLFKAFELCQYGDTKVVLLGQDPYHNNGQATGLSFSVPSGFVLPPSLKNIYKELLSDLGVKRTDGCLVDLARQGVLLLNSSLSVRENKPASHFGLGWQLFCDSVLTHLNQKASRIVFLLWGNFAKSKAVHITNPIHKVLTSGHPSPLSARFFLNNKHFSKTNQLLIEAGLDPINWG